MLFKFCNINFNILKNLQSHRHCGTDVFMVLFINKGGVAHAHKPWRVQMDRGL